MGVRKSGVESPTGRRYLPFQLCVNSWGRMLRLPGPLFQPVKYSGGTPFSELRWRSEEHTSELQSLMRISYAVFCLKKKNNMKIENCQYRSHTNNRENCEKYI